MSKGGGQKSTTTTAPPAWVQPIIQGVAHDITGTVHGNADALQGLSSSLTDALPGIQSMALDQSGLQPGQNYLDSVLSGHYLGQNNPYLNQMIQQTGQDVGNKVNSTFSQAGRTGGGANQQLLSKGLADSENSLRYQDYSNERNNMTQAASQLPSYQAARLSGISPLLAAYQTAGQLPYYGVNAESGIGSLFGGFSNSTTKQSGSNGLLGGLLGGILGL
jgi:hypothetical protein